MRETEHFESNLTSIVRGESGNVFEVSYKVSYHIYRSDEAHMIVEHLVKPCVTDVLSFMRFDKHLKSIENFFKFNCFKKTRGY
jgi:hypothetical protein